MGDQAAAPFCVLGLQNWGQALPCQVNTHQRKNVHNTHGVKGVKGAQMVIATHTPGEKGQRGDDKTVGTLGGSRRWVREAQLLLMGLDVAVSLPAVKAIVAAQKHTALALRSMLAK